MIEQAGQRNPELAVAALEERVRGLEGRLADVLRADEPTSQALLRLASLAINDCLGCHLACLTGVVRLLLRLAACPIMLCDRSGAGWWA